MSIINFNNEYKPCIKTWAEITKDYIDANPDEIIFKIGDKVRINFDVLSSEMKDKIKDQVYEVIDYVLSFDSDNIKYKLNSGVERNLANKHQLILIK